MSGICGIMYFDERRASLEEIAPMNKAIAFRGRDESGARAEGPVALGNCLLRTTPESLHEHFPMEDSEAGLILTADARIDNRAELISALAITLSSERPITDGELILWAYRKWGEGCPEHLLGDFAFAIWNVRERTLFCARDHFGARPFCYYQDKGRFLFASEVSGIIAIPDVPRRLNESFLANFLAGIMIDSKSTGFQDVNRLQASHSFQVHANGEITTRRYWRLDPDREIRFTTDEAYYEGFREKLFEAVECRCRSITPVAAELSCGLDSSMVAAAAQRFLRSRGRSLKTFNIQLEIFCSDDIVELPYDTNPQPLVDLTVAHLGIEEHCYVTTDKDAPGAMETMRCMLERFGTPKNSLSGFTLQALHRLVEKGGMKVHLSGLGGDQIASHNGRGFYTELVSNRQWKTLWNEAKGIELNYRTSRYRFLLSAVFQGRYPRLRRLLRRFRRNEDVGVLDISQKPLAYDFARRMDIFAKYNQWRSVLFDTIPGLSFKGHQILDAEWSYVPECMEEISSTALLHSVECRYPLLDKRLAEYVLAVPSHIKVRDGWRRRLARKSIESLLPLQVVWRPSKHESGIAPHYKDCIVKDIAALERMANAIRNDPVVVRYVNAQLMYDAILRMKCEAFKGRPFVRVIWPGTMAAMFLKTIERTG